MLGLPAKFFAQLRVLRCYTDGARVQMTFAHHDAALNHQRRRSETKLIGPKQRANHHITTGLHLTVGLHANATAQLIEHQGLLYFCKPQLPRRAAMLDRRNRRCAGAAVVSRNYDVICFALRDTGSDRSDSDFTDQLDADARIRVRVFQIVNELRQIFNRINIMVWRRRNQADTRHRETQLRDVFRHFVARQLTAFSGFRALRHLDLDLIGTREIFGGDTEATRRDLLNFRAKRITFFGCYGIANAMRAETRLQCLAFGQRDIALCVFAAFTRIRFAADAVHCNRKCGVRFCRNRAERHRTRGEAFDDFFRGFNLFQRHRCALFELEVKQSTQRFQFAGLVVDQCGVFFVSRCVVSPCRVLQLGDDLGRPHVLFAARTHSVFAARVKHFGKHGVVAERQLVQSHLLFGNFENADALHA